MYKRAFDLVFGLLALILALPLMVILALLVYLDDGSPIVFRQTRVGRNGRCFEIYTFRTMIKNAEQLRAEGAQRDADVNLIHKTKNDPRVTRAVHILRRFSLDLMFLPGR